MNSNRIVTYNGALPRLNLSELFADDFIGWVDEIFRDFGMPAFRKTFEGHPVANVKVNSRGDVRIEVAVTGYDEDKISVEIEDGVLSVSASGDEQAPRPGCEMDCDSTGYRSIFRRIRTGPFERRWQLPKELDCDQATASMKNGMLTVDVPMKRDAKSNKIKLKIAR